MFTQVNHSRQPVVAPSRIIACQGSAQLVAAVTAFRLQQTERADQEDTKLHLLIFELNLFDGSDQDFAAVIEQLGRELLNIDSIQYLGTEWLREAERRLRTDGDQATLGWVRESLNVSDCREIFVSRSWQLANRLLLRSFPSARKICYGDGTGVYFPENHSAPRLGIGGFIDRSVRRLLRGESLLPQKPVSLAPIECDAGYLAFPKAFGYSPPFPYQEIPQSALWKTFQDLVPGLARESEFRELSKDINTFPGVVLFAGCNFSESRQMDFKDELSAYVEFLKQENLLDPTALLIVKPHPRDTTGKLAALSELFNPRYKKVTCLTTRLLRFAPFESILLGLEEDHPGLLARTPLITFSSACLTLSQLCPRWSLGFGAESVNRHFWARFRKVRIRHESDLRNAASHSRVSSAGLPRQHSR